MKKVATLLTVCLVSTGSIAGITGHGYTLLEHKVTVSPGVEGYSVDKPPILSQKKSMVGSNYAVGHSATAKKGVPVTLTGEHEVSIQNLSGYTRTYAYGYWLRSNNKLYRVDDKVSIIHNGVFMLSDTSTLKGVVYNSTGSFALEACTYSTDNQTACDHESVTVNK